MYNLVYLKTYRTTGLPVRNNPLTNIQKGFSSEMTLEVAEGRLQIAGLCILKTHAFAWLNAFLQKNWYNLNKSIYCFHWFSCYFIAWRTKLENRISAISKLILASWNFGMYILRNITLSTKTNGIERVFWYHIVY